jgi:glycosyltransferase involved in cell wall biosynthesis
MRALVIAPQPFYSPRGTPFSVYYRTLVTAELGVEVDLLTYGQGQDVDIPGVRIHRIPDFAFLGRIKTGPSLLKLFLDVFLVLWTLGLLLRRRYDFVHAHEEAVFFCVFLQPLFRFKLVYDMHSSLPQQLTNFQFTRSRALIGLFAALENASLRRADAVITICPALAEQALEQVPPERHLLIENSLFDPIRLKGRGGAPPPEPAPLPLPEDRPLVLYAGTFESYQGLDVAIAAFAKVRVERPDAFLVLLGGTPAQVEEKRALVQRLGLEEHSLLPGSVPKAVVHDVQRRAEVLLSPRSEGTNTPLKIYEQLASGIPLVATRIPSHTQVLSDAVCFLVEPEPDSMAQGILAALGDAERREAVVRGALALYQEKYSRSVYVAKMKRLLEVLR